VVDVAADSIQDHRGRLDLADERIARSAEQPANASRCVAVVDNEHPAISVTEQAAAILSGPHSLDFGLSESVLRHECSSPVLRLGCLGVLPSPLTQPLVASHLVGLPVVPVPGADAPPAFSPVAAPVRKGLIRHIDRAHATDHVLSIARMHGMVTALDQPCHADVLLELANNQGTEP